MNKRGVLLVNLGSPDSPSVSDVRKYLREFLMDGRVIDVPWPIRFFVVHACILPFRPKQSAEAYHTIWQSDGSPLVRIGQKVQSELQQRVPVPVQLAMRYRNPSIADALGRLRQEGVEDLLLIPLFPHYAMSSFETAAVRVEEVLARESPGMRLTVVPPYYAEPGYIEALVGSASNYLQEGYDHLLFSFHGLPERHLHKTDPTRSHCLRVDNCCNVPSPAHAKCYRRQCFATVDGFVRRAGLSRYSVAFQSRLGRQPWLRPYTDQEVVRLAREGVQKLLVICPAFVADCLETLEEIGLRARDSFLQAGGKQFRAIPCLNDHPLWLAALEKMIRRFLDDPGGGRRESVRSGE